MSIDKKTLIVDSSYIARNVISSERAFIISYKGNAEILVEHPETFQLINPKLKIHKPSVIRVFKFIDMPFGKVQLTRENVFKRDNWECVYCGCDRRTELTIDHIVPRSKGGPNTWGNLVTACKRCNCEKSDLTIEEYGKPQPNAYRPHYLQMIKGMGSHEIPIEWKPYLFIEK